MWIKEVLNFENLLECYTLLAKRKFGYFSLPLLYESEFIGQIDSKADRKKKQLLFKNLVCLTPFALNFFLIKFKNSNSSIGSSNSPIIPEPLLELLRSCKTSYAHIHLIPINEISDMNFKNQRIELNKDDFQNIRDKIIESS